MLLGATMTCDVTPSPEDDHDVQLLRRIQGGETAALETLLLRHRDAIWRVAVRFVGNAADAEDVVQEVCILCLTKRMSHAGRGSVRSWMLAVTANAARQRLRAQRRRRDHERRSVPVAPPPPPDEGMGELRAVAMAGLADLPERYRVVLSMRHFDALSDADIAGALGLREASVRTRAARGLERLRAALGRRGFSVTAVALASALTCVAAESPSHLVTVIQAGIAQGASMPAKVTVAAWSLGKIAVACAGVVLVSAALSQMRPAPRLALTPDGAAVMSRVTSTQLLDLVVTVRVDDDLSGAIHRLLLALPLDQRPVIAAPERLLNLEGAVIAGMPPRIAVRLRGDFQQRPLRDVLDALCHPAGLRWTATRSTIVIDRPMVAAELHALVDRFATVGDAASAEALAFAVDTDALRPLVLALADPQRSAVAEAAMQRVLQPQFPYRPSPVRRFADAPDVTAAVATALAASRPSSGMLIELAGLLHLDGLVPSCLPVLEAGSRSVSWLEQMQGGIPRRKTIAWSAIRAMGWSGDLRAVQPLIDVVQRNGGSFEVGTGIAALAELRDVRAVEPLLAVVAQGGGWTGERTAAIEALAVFPDPRCAAVLGRILLDRREDWPTRAAAAAALGRRGDEESRGFLLEQCRRHLASADETAVTTSSITSLAWVADAAAAAVCIDLLSDYYCGSTAARGIGIIGDPELVQTLGELLRNGKHRGDDYMHIVDAIAAIRHPDASSLLVATIPTDTERLWAHASALADCGTPEARAALCAIARESDRERRRQVARSLARSGGEARALALQLIEQDADPEVRVQALQGFGPPLGLAQQAASEAIWEGWLHHQLMEVRRAAVSGLIYHYEEFASTFVWTQIAAALSDPSPAVREQAVSTWRGMKPIREGDPALWRRILGLLASDPDSLVRCAVARSAFQEAFSGDLSAAELRVLLEGLAKALASDTDARVRAEAGVGLMRIVRLGEQKDLPVPTKSHRAIIATAAAKDPDPQVRGNLQRLLDPAQDFLNTEVEWKPDPASPPESHPAADPPSDF